jgi:hopene-associated glycosyltransferase HpnB
LILALTALAALGLAAWLYLVFLRHGFWRAAERLPQAPAPQAWPAVAVVVPARDEAQTIAATIAALLAQDYPGPLTITLVDDGSSDGTGDIARGLAARDSRLRVVQGTALPAGWSGKLWALETGVRAASADAGTKGPDFIFLTDADTVHAPATLRRLVAHAEADRRDMVSLMVRLACESAWERLLTPAFVFFFQMLYPFAAVNDDRDPAAGAAGACVLVRRAALARAGGIAAIRAALIDDCALAAVVKRTGGRLWLGLAEDSASLRRYTRLAEFWDMVARTAYTQLRYSPVLLAGTVLAMVVIYLAPPVLLAGALAAGAWLTAALAGAALALMLASFRPILRYYRLPAWRAATLPAVAALYVAMTVDSALRHFRGRGGGWKGRHYAAAGSRSNS